MTLLEDVGQQAVPAESVPALQSDGFDEHLQANRATELLPQKFLLNFTNEGRVRAIAVGRAIHPLVHRAVNRRING